MSKARTIKGEHLRERIKELEEAEPSKVDADGADLVETEDAGDGQG